VYLIVMSASKIPASGAISSIGPKVLTPDPLPLSVSMTPATAAAVPA
jgi:hypothetical protein